jgi:hypothetical protein
MKEKKMSNEEQEALNQEIVDTLDEMAITIAKMALIVVDLNKRVGILEKVEQSRLEKENK